MNKNVVITILLITFAIRLIALDNMISSLDEKTAKKLSQWADYIVVGAGAAGSVVAARLAENPNNNVLVIELGPNNSGNKFIETPNENMKLWDNPDGPKPSPTSLAFETKPQVERTYRYPRGNGLGGSTNHHTLIDGRGSPKIYDNIAQLVGDDRWSAFGHHISGTAKMGKESNPTAVVDTQLRVIGIPNLRIIDTSIYPYPYLHGYNTARGAYLIGEIGSDLIKNTNKKKNDKE